MSESTFRVRLRRDVKIRNRAVGVPDQYEADEVIEVTTRELHDMRPRAFHFVDGEGNRTDHRGARVAAGASKAKAKAKAKSKAKGKTRAKSDGNAAQESTAAKSKAKSSAKAPEERG